MGLVKAPEIHLTRSAGIGAAIKMTVSSTVRRYGNIEYFDISGTKSTGAWTIIS